MLKGLREKDITTYLAILSFCIFLFPVFIGGIVSIAFVPVLVTRYMTCSFGLFVLSLAFILSKTLGYPIFRKLSYLFFLFLFIDGGIRLYSGLSYYNQTEKEYSQLQQFAKSENGGRQILIANDFSYHVIPRLQIISPDNDYAVWVQDQNKEIFEPFSFDEILSGNIENKEFVLVRQDREAIQEKFRLCQLQLQKDFLVVDSLRVSDIILYKMKHR